MIIDTIHGDIFRTPYKHIAFAVNTEGYNDAGFAGVVSSRHWPELTCIGAKKLGDVISKDAEDKTFHALVCHSLGLNGWNETFQTVTKCLDSIDVSESEIIAITLIGGGAIGKMHGADVFSIFGGIARSKKKIAVYTL